VRLKADLKVERTKNAVLKTAFLSLYPFFVDESAKFYRFRELNFESA